MAGLRYLQAVQDLIQTVEKEERSALEQAANLVAEAIAQDRMLHLFGTGHSHLLAEEGLYRAGTLAAVNAFLEPGLMLHQGAVASGRLERLEGLATIILAKHRFSPDDVLIIFSNSGVNAVPVEMALQARAQGLQVIAVTSRAYSEQIPPCHPSGQKLFQIADLVIDNHVPPGDAALELEGLQRVGPCSTVIGAVILHTILTQVADSLRRQGLTVPVYMSSNRPGAAEHNAALVSRYKDRVTCL